MIDLCCSYYTHKPYRPTLKYAWLHILRYEVSLHRGDWSWWWSHDMYLTQAKGNGSSSSSSLGKPKGCWHSTPDCQRALKEDLHLHHIRHTKRLDTVSVETLCMSYSMKHARNKWADWRSVVITAYTHSCQSIHLPTQTFLLSQLYNFQRGFLLPLGLLVWSDWGLARGINSSIGTAEIQEGQMLKPTELHSGWSLIQPNSTTKATVSTRA